MNVLILGLTITSSWGNGHATTYRSLCRALHEDGHTIAFLEKDVPWYAGPNRDAPLLPYCRIRLYSEWREARTWLRGAARDFDLVLIGSFFPDGVAAADLLFEAAACPIVFYDIDTPVTLQRLAQRGEVEAIASRQIPHYDCYLSFTGGPTLDQLRQQHGARRVAPFYCSVDSDLYQATAPEVAFRCDLSYLGTYAADRQARLDALLNAPARALPRRRFLLAGAQYPADIAWPANVTRLEHVAPGEHPRFYSSSRFTLNLTRAAMIEAGYSPSVRLFEAGACGTVILSDNWPGLADFFEPGREILLPADAAEVVRILQNLGSREIANLAAAARARVLDGHTHRHRARQLAALAEELAQRPAERRPIEPEPAVV